MSAVSHAGRGAASRIRPEARFGGALGLALVLAGTGCTDLLLPAPEATTGEELYAELWRAFDRRYAPFTERGVDWDAAFERHHPGTSADDEDAFDAATRLLAELDDGHVTLVAPGRPVFVAQRTFRDRSLQLHLDPGLVFRRFVEGPFVSGPARYGLLPGGIGYVHVAHWDTGIPELDDLMGYLEGRAAVIVDLRHNPGGDFLHGFEFARRFADRKRLAFSTLTRTGPERGRLGQRVEWSIEPAGSPRYPGPVVLLTNGYTNSAAERTAMAFRAMPQVTSVGSRTAGNHGEKVGGELSNGWRYSLVPQVVRGPDGVSYEGSGLPPDVEVENTADEISAGLDRQFEAALELLREAASAGG